MKAPLQKLEKIVEKSGTGILALMQPHLDVDKGNLVATNGKALIIVPVEIEPGDTSGPVSLAGLKSARRDKKGDRSLSVNGDEIVSTGPDAGTKFPRPDAGDFPDYTTMTPDKGKAKYSIDLSAELLETLCAAIKSPGGDGTVSGDKFTRLTFHFPDLKSSFGVLIEAGNGATAVIMPLAYTGD